MNGLSEQDTKAPRTRARLLALTAAITMGLVGIATGTAYAAKPPSPVTVGVVGTLAPTGETTFQLTGTGLSTPLGAVAYTGQVTVTGLDPDTGTITDVLIETITAANGDTITLRCEQVAVPVGSGVYRGTDTWTVIGGTGRYGQATGSGTGTTYVDLSNGTFAKVLTGVISTSG